MRSYFLRINGIVGGLVHLGIGCTLGDFVLSKNFLVCVGLSVRKVYVFAQEIFLREKGP